MSEYKYRPIQCKVCKKKVILTNGFAIFGPVESALRTAMTEHQECWLEYGEEEN